MAGMPAGPLSVIIALMATVAGWAVFVGYTGYRYNG